MRASAGLTSRSMRVFSTPGDAGKGVATREPAAAAAAAERASKTGPGGSHWHAGRACK